MRARIAIYGISFSGIVISLLLLNLQSILPTESLSEDTLAGLRILAIALVVISLGMVLLAKPLARLANQFFSETGVALTSLKAQFRQALVPENRVYLLLVLILMGLAAALRILYIRQPMRTDESLTYLNYVSKPIYLAISDYSAPNNHLFHTFWAWIAIRLFGDTAIILRLTTFVSGVLIVPISFEMIRAHYNKRAALFTAGLVAVSSVLIEYATNARGYSLQMLLIFLSLRIAYALRTSWNMALWASFALVNALALYTIPTGLYAVSGIYLWLAANVFIERDEEWPKRLRAVVYSGLLMTALTLLLYAPVVIVTGIGSLTSNTYVTPLAFPLFISSVGEMLQATVAQWHTSMPLPIALLLLVGFVIALVKHRKLSDYPLTLALPLLLVCALLITFQRVAPYTRVWLYLLPIYLGMASAGLIWLIDLTKQSKFILPALGLIGLVWGTALVVSSDSPYWSKETGTFRDAEAVINDLAPLIAEEPEARIIYEHPSGEMLHYYARHHDLPEGAISQGGVTPPILYVVVNTEYPQTLESVLLLNGIDAALYSEPKQIIIYHWAAIYRAVRQ
ncbi:MAG: hypothetical protein H6670_03600 [Anaerolineaceae bacterium]|nr:hypothetical protein [Anaerolineaceae bacterium]